MDRRPEFFHERAAVQRLQGAVAQGGQIEHDEQQTNDARAHEHGIDEGDQRTENTIDYTDSRTALLFFVLIDILVLYVLIVSRAYAAQRRLAAGTEDERKQPVHDERRQNGRQAPRTWTR